MNKIIKSSLVALLLSANNFAFSASNITTPIYQISETQGTFIQVPLTHDIYRFSHEANLSDIVVLDMMQNKLSYRLAPLAPEQEKAVQPAVNVVASDALPFYPVPVDATPDTIRKLHTTQVKVQGSSVQISTTDKTQNNQNPEFYLIDVSKLVHDINSLTIDWVANEANQYLEIELEGSRNLQDWSLLGHNTLVLINQQDQVLKRNQIDVNIAKKDFEFLRVRVLRGGENLQITGVTAEQKNSVEAAPQPVIETWSLTAQLAKNQTSVYFANSHSKSTSVSAWEFTRAESTPVDTLNIDFGNSAYGDIAKIFSRNSEEQNWQLLQKGIWFNAQVGDQWQKSEPVNVNRNTDKYWRIELNEAAKGNTNPVLVLGWKPVQLQIITNNKPPYKLAVSKLSDESYTRNQVFNELIGKAKPTWTTSSLISLNVKPEEIHVTENPVNWTQWLFWAALILAVIVLLIFSLKLFKQMQHQPKS